MNGMEYRMQPGAVGGEAANRLGLQGKTRAHARPGTGGSPSVGKTGAIRTGSAVVVHSSFQAFLAEQTALQASGNAGGQAVSDFRTPSQSTEPAQTTKEIVHTLQKGETIWELARERYRVDPAEILRRNNIVDSGTLQAGRKISIPAKEKSAFSDSTEEVVAGWYGRYHQGRLMANGQRFDMHAATIAHRDIPIGTKVELENPATREKAKAVVTDRGPFHRDRDIDLSYGLAKRLSLAKQGVGNLRMRVL
jgi:rare lipoprotein A